MDSDEAAAPYANTHAKLISLINSFFARKKINERMIIQLLILIVSH